MRFYRSTSNERVEGPTRQLGVSGIEPLACHFSKQTSNTPQISPYTQQRMLADWRTPLPLMHRISPTENEHTPGRTELRAAGGKGDG